MKQQLIHAATALALSVAVAFPASAGSVAGTGGATEVTQILNNVELVSQSAQLVQQVNYTLQQVQMMQRQLQNLVAAPQMVWGEVEADLSQLTSLVSKGQALGYALGNIDTTFANQYPGYSSSRYGGNYSSKASAWTKTSLDSLKAALNAAGLQSSQFSTEQSAMASIRSMAATAPGALQVAQAGVMVANAQVEQLQKLRQLTMAQMQAQSAYLAKQEQQSADDRSTMDSHFKRYVPKGGAVSSAGGKN